MKEDNAAYLSQAISVSTLIMGEAMQVATFFGKMDYNFIVGHLSDFGAGGCLTTMGVMMTEGKSRFAKILGATIPATSLTIREYFPITNIENVIDSWDAACYWAAAGMVVGGVQYISNDEFRSNVNSVIKKLNPFRRNYSSIDSNL